MQVIRYARLPIFYDAGQIQNELSLSAKAWMPHFNTYDYTGSWHVLTLRSPGGNEANIFAELMANSTFADTIYMERFPAVKKIVNALNCPIMSVRFLNLQAGAVIKQHRDNELAFEKGEARLHFPIFTNPQVEFYCEDDRIVLQEGECWYLNANLPHRVTNNGDADRIHLVIDCKVNEWLKETMASAVEIAHKYIDEKPELLKMIAALRQQNTAAADTFAEKLEQRLEFLRAENPN